MGSGAASSLGEGLASRCFSLLERRVCALQGPALQGPLGQIPHELLPPVALNSHRFHLHNVGMCPHLLSPVDDPASSVA